MAWITSKSSVTWSSYSLLTRTSTRIRRRKSIKDLSVSDAEFISNGLNSPLMSTSDLLSCNIQLPPTLVLAAFPPSSERRRQTTANLQDCQIPNLFRQPIASH